MHTANPLYLLKNTVDKDKSFCTKSWIKSSLSGHCWFLLIVCISVCCAERPVSPLCNHWSLLASYPLNISVFVGRLWGGILAMPLDLSRELQIIPCVCIYEKKREFVCASFFVSVLLFIYKRACVSVYSPLCSF